MKLHAGAGGEFASPYEFVWDDGEYEDVATPSQLSKATPSEVPKATPSNATSWSIQSAQNKNLMISEFAVDDNKLTLEDVTQAATEAGIDPSDVLWLTEEKNLDSQFPEKGLTLTKGNIKDLYAVHKIDSEVNSSQVSQVESFNTEGVSLVVNDLAAGEQLTTEDALKKAVEAAGIKDAKGLNVEDLIQLDIRPSDAKYNNSKFIIRLTLPWDFLEKIKPGKDLFVLHKHDNKWTEVSKDWYEDSRNIIEFTLDKFSPVVIGIKDAEPVMVTLKNVPDGAGIVYAWSEDPETGKRIMTYIPIGATVPVPVGTELQFYGYSMDGASCVFKVQEEGGEANVVDYWYYVVGDKDITIIPEFTPEKVTDNNNDKQRVVIRNSNLTNDNRFTGDLRVRYKEKFVDVTNWQFALPDNEWELQRTKNDLFNLDKDGHLSSKDKLEAGSYQLYVSYEHNGERLEGKAWVNVGFNVWFGASLGKFKDGTLVADGLGESPYYLNETDFSKICQDTEMDYEIALFGNFTWAKWYDENEVELTGKINSYTNAYAIILDAEGNPYQPTIGNSQNKPDDKPDDKPTVRPTTGGSSSGGSSDGSMNLNVLVGSWKKDDKGWWYQLRDGSYAKDRWGIIGGSWYYFGSDGYMKTGWLYWNEGWYYLTAADGNDIGKMKTGWFYDEALGNWFYLNNSDGKMETGWKQIGSIWYYFNPNSDGRKGAMESNKWIGNYFLGTTGAWDKDMVQ